MPDVLQAVESFLTERDVAAILNVSHRTLQTWRVKGSGPAFVKFEGTVRYRPKDLEAFIAARICAPIPEGDK